MQDFFNFNDYVKYGGIIVPNWDMNKNILKSNLEKVNNYYKENTIPVKNSHLLVRMVNSMTLPFRYPIERYADIWDYNSLTFANNFNLTSSIDFGILHSNVFYGGNSKEIIIANNNSFDIFKAERNWKLARPISVLSSEKTDLNLQIPDGTNSTVVNGINVFSINIPLLAVQYRGFVLEQYNRIQRGLTAKSNGYFVKAYCLNNMIYSDLDHVLFNRLRQKIIKEKNKDVIIKHPFFITDISSNLEKHNNYLLDYFHKNEIGFEKILSNIPMVNKNNSKELMMIPDLAPTVQVFWATVISRLNVIEMLININKNKGLRTNMDDLNYLLRMFDRVEKNNVLSSTLDPEDRYRILNRMKVIREIVKSR